MTTAAPRHLAPHRASLLRRVAMIFGLAVAVTALALALSAYFITKAAQDEDSLNKALTQSRMNLYIADSMLPGAPINADYTKLIDAYQTRGDFNTLIEAGAKTYFSAFATSAEVARGLVTPALAAKVAEGHIGYQTILIAGEPNLAVGGAIRNGDLAIYFFYPQSARLADLARLRNVLIIAGVILAVLGAFAGYVLARGLVRPIRRASKAAVRMSEGDLGIRLPAGADEFGVLAGSFNRMAENLQTKMLDLEAGQARERRFVADVTHELRTPVSALVGEASLLRSRLEAEPSDCSPEVRRLVGMVNTDIGRLRELVDDLLEISRLDAQAAETLIEPVELPSFLDQLVRARGWTDRVTVTGAPAESSSRPSQPPAQEGTEELVAQADRRRVERIVVNLVENALRHGEPPVTLQIRATANVAGERVLQIVVTDAGGGIPAEHLPYIFDRFYKADPSRSASRGSGLGLAIARENARLLGGDLSAANIPGGGARFVLSLPAAEI